QGAPRHRAPARPVSRQFPLRLGPGRPTPLEPDARRRGLAPRPAPVLGPHRVPAGPRWRTPLATTNAPRAPTTEALLPSPEDPPLRFGIIHAPMGCWSQADRRKAIRRTLAREDLAR